MLTKQMLLDEKEFYEKILAEVKKRIANEPAGGIRISSNKGYYKYYYTSSDKANRKLKGKYVSKNGRVKISSKPNINELHKTREKTKIINLEDIMQKPYNHSVQNFTEKHLKCIDRILDYYMDEPLEELFSAQHTERQKYIVPIRQPWNEFVREWLENGESSCHMQEQLKIMTNSGVVVRSKSEKIIADYLYSNGIPFIYEKPLYFKDGTFIIPDFTLLDKKTRKQVYFEHFGLMDNPDYARSAVKKIQRYAENGIYIGINLIVSFETNETTINISNVGETISRLCL